MPSIGVELEARVSNLRCFGLDVIDDLHRLFCQRVSSRFARAHVHVRKLHAEAFFGRPLFTHALGHVGKHIELGHEHQPTFALSPSALLKAGADRHCPPSSLPWWSDRTGCPRALVRADATSHSFPSSNDTVFWMQCLSRLIGGGGLKLLGHEWVFSRRRDARLEGSLEISRRFSPNVFKWYGATLVIAANYTGRPGQSRGGLPL